MVEGQSQNGISMQHRTCLYVALIAYVTAFAFVRGCLPAPTKHPANSAVIPDKFQRVGPPVWRITHASFAL